jgi:taurine dioxygenase
MTSRTFSDPAVAPESAGIVVRRQAGALGAIVTGVDLARQVDDLTFSQIKTASREHLVICLRDQAHITPADQIAFARRWGDIWTHPYIPSIQGFPEIMLLSDPHPISSTWHQDTTHGRQPPAYTMLLGRVIPPFGGDTQFANSYLAYDGLSEGLREVLDEMRAVHQGTELAQSAGLEVQAVTSVHPVIRVHPETRRKSLFVNANYVTNFEGWTRDESRPLLQYLYGQIARSEYTYRHRWQTGDLLVWDNRCAMHAVIGDTAGAERKMHRITIAGETPIGPAD